MHFNKLVVTGAAAFASIALVGLGAGASFTDSFSASQHIATGKINVELSPTGSGGWAKSLALPAQDNQGSTIDFSTTVYAENFGSLSAVLDNFTVTDAGGSADLEQAIDVTVTAVDGSGVSGVPTVSIYSLVHGSQPYDLTPIPANLRTLDASALHSITFHFTSAGSLDTSLQGKAINPTVTVNASES
jgi:hypothetical protein